MNLFLHDYIKIKRRYTRSVNLERDIEVADSVNGYVLTPKSEELIHRFFEALTSPNAVRAWTLTGVYGTGKSAFAHFLTALCSAKDEKIRLNAVHILRQAGSPTVRTNRNIADRGLIKAVATAQREPVSHTLVRALWNGGYKYWKSVRGVKPNVLADLEAAHDAVEEGKQIDDKHVLSLVKGLGAASKAGLLIVIDELGKNLEYAAQHQAGSDLYILQQIAELPSGEGKPCIFFIGLLHQAFYEYSHGLASSTRSEWAKIQGRFEDIPFSESTDRILHIMKHAIDYADEHHLKSKIRKWSTEWESVLQSQEIASRGTFKNLSSVYPMHPITAAALPILCNKFSQNDRTLFTFLSSDEPHSFKTFLKTTVFPSDNLTTLKLDQLYDYFIESAGMASSSRPQYQRWLEIQGRIAEAKNLHSDEIRALKVIGVLNLISNGSLKASHELVILSLSDAPGSYRKSKWDEVMDHLVRKSFVTPRMHDELRIWEGSDFDFEQALSDQNQAHKQTLSELLNIYSPLKPLIPRRHNYEYGAVRYFETRYVDCLPENIECTERDSDGIAFYVVSSSKPLHAIPATTSDNRPVVVIVGHDQEILRTACYEYAALKNVWKSSKQLQTDGVARREVGQRIYDAGRYLEDTLTRSFDLKEVKCWISGEKKHFKSDREFNSTLSNLCDSTFSKGPRLWNELINRRELTSQGAKARRELVEALINNPDKEKLGISGYGPEYSMYESLIRVTGIHILREDGWNIDEPKRNSGIYGVWKAIEKFCISATNGPRSINELYNLIERPPYGVKKGITPVLLFTVLLRHSEYLSIYFDGSYVPILGADHFDLLVKQPDHFAVKYFEISGLKAQIFKELEEVVTASAPNKKSIRNATVLSIVNPLIRFVRGLPQHTQRTQNLSDITKAVRAALLEAKEPDTLLFTALPQACGYSFLNLNSTSDAHQIKIFRKKLIHALQEMQAAHGQLVNQSRAMISQLFATGLELKPLRRYLKAIASRVNANTQVIELNLKRFINALIDEQSDDNRWVEALLMVIADKPVDSWTDNDVLVFEVKLSEIVRRFKNLEAIIDLKGEINEGFDARKITVTYPNGKEINEVVWLDQKDKEEVKRIAEKVVDSLMNNNDKINKAILTAIIERVFEEEEKSGHKERSEKKRYGK